MSKLTSEDVMVGSSLETVKNRVRVVALVELLVEKGIITKLEIEQKMNEKFEEKKYEYAQEMLNLSEEDWQEMINSNS